MGYQVTELRAKIPTIHARGTRRTQYTLAEALPELGAHTSMPEQMVAAELNRRRIRWSPQVAMAGGRNSAGGMVVDFVLPDHQAVIRIQGVYFHVGDRAQADDAGAMYLRAQGWRVIDITDTDVTTDVREAIGSALGEMIR